MSKLKPRQPSTARTPEEWLEEFRTREPRSRPKVKFIDGKPHRERRGKLVEIPDEWFGKVTHKQTIRKRDSKDGQGPSYRRKEQR